MTFGKMQARIGNELIRSDLESEIRDAIQTAIRYYEGMALPWTEGRSDAVATPGVAAVPAPADFLRADTLSVTAGGARYRLEPRDWRTMDGLIGITTGRGRPSVWAWYDRQFWLYPTPDAAYSLTLSYRRRLDPLVLADDTNPWMVEGEALIRARAKAELYLHVLSDPSMAGVMNQAAEQALARLTEVGEAQIALGWAAPTAF